MSWDLAFTVVHFLLSVNFVCLLLWDMSLGDDCRSRNVVFETELLPLCLKPNNRIPCCCKKRCLFRTGAFGV